MAVSRRWKTGLAAVGLGAATLLVASSQSGATVGGNDRVSVTSAGGQLTGSSAALLDMTPSGQYVVLASDASELGMSPSAAGVFVRDRLADTTTRVDNVTNGVPSRAAISDDGRYLIYVSSSSIRLLDRTAGTTVTVGTASPSSLVAISGDGSTVAYTLSNGAASTRATSTGTVTALGTGDVQALSSTGRYLVWKPAASAGISRLDRQTSTTVLVSKNTSGTPVAAPRADISADGTRIVFHTSANSVVAGDTDAMDDVFLWDDGTAVAVPSGTAYASDPSISADGAAVSYFSRATAGGPGEHLVRTLPTSTGAEAAARRIDNGSGAATQTVTASRLSNDGRYVAYSSSDSGLVTGDTNGLTDVFVRDRFGDLSGPGAGTITGSITGPTGSPVEAALIEVTGPRGTFTAFSEPDGTYSFAPLPSGRWTLSASAAGRTSRYYLDGQSAGGARPVFVDDGETVALDAMVLPEIDARPASIVTRTGFLANGASSGGSISADGRYVGFTSAASNLVPGDTNGVSDVFVADRQTDAITRVSVSSTGAQLAQGSTGGHLSEDGRRVVFVTAADGVVSGDADGALDTFVRNLDSGTSTKTTFTTSSVLRRPASGGGARLSGDGEVVSYPLTTGFVTGRVDGTGTPIRDTSIQAIALGPDGTMSTRETTPTSVSGRTVVAGSTNLGVASPSNMSRNGRWVVYSTDGNDLNVLDRQTSTTTVHSTRWGTGGWTGSRSTTLFSTEYSLVKIDSTAVSNDGRYVLFSGILASTEPLSDRNGVADVFLLDRQTEDIRRVSVGNDRTELTTATTAVDLSADGRTALVRGSVTRDDTNGFDDLVAIDLDDDRTGVPGTGELHGTVTSGGDPVAGAMVRVITSN